MEYIITVLVLGMSVIKLGVVKQVVTLTHLLYLFNEIKGDAFAPRNKMALAIDFEEEPPFFQVSETHFAKTWLLDPRAPKVEKPKVILNLQESMKGRG